MTDTNYANNLIYPFIESCRVRFNQKNGKKYKKIIHTLNKFAENLFATANTALQLREAEFKQIVMILTNHALNLSNIDIIFEQTTGEFYAHKGANKNSNKHFIIKKEYDNIVNLLDELDTQQNYELSRAIHSSINDSFDQNTESSKKFVQLIEQYNDLISVFKDLNPENPFIPQYLLEKTGFSLIDKGQFDEAFSESSINGKYNPLQDLLIKPSQFIMRQRVTMF